MRIVYIHQYFITPEEAGGARSYYLAKRLVDLGHEVIMITSNTKNEDWSLVESKLIDGIKVLYIKNDYKPAMRNFSRIFSYIRFMFLSTFLAVRQKNIDIVYATSTPLTIAIPALAVKFFQRNKFIFELRDIWPDIPYEMGYLKNKIIYKIIKRFERYIYKKSDKIITISKGISLKIGDTYKGKIYVFPFGSDLELFNTIKGNQWKISNKINTKILYVFTGAVGVANGVDYLIEAAKILQDVGNTDIHISIIGDGSNKDKIIELIKQYELLNISVYNSVPINELNRILASANAGIILFGDRSETYRYTASPNKFFDYIGAGLPFFYNFSGPLSDEIISKNIGVYTDYLKPKDLADKMIYYSKYPEKFKIMSTNARKLAEVKYDRNEILDNLTSTILTY